MNHTRPQLCTAALHSWRREEKRGQWPRLLVRVKAALLPFVLYHAWLTCITETQLLRLRVETIAHKLTGGIQMGETLDVTSILNPLITGSQSRYWAVRGSVFSSPVLFVWLCIGAILLVCEGCVFTILFFQGWAHCECKACIVHR